MNNEIDIKDPDVKKLYESFKFIEKLNFFIDMDEITINNDKGKDSDNNV